MKWRIVKVEENTGNVYYKVEFKDFWFTPWDSGITQFKKFEDALAVWESLQPKKIKDKKIVVHPVYY